MLKEVQLHLSVHAGKKSTHSELSDLAGVGKRCLGCWITGRTTPVGITAAMRLLSMLDDEEVCQIVKKWQINKLHS